MIRYGLVLLALSALASCQHTDHDTAAAHDAGQHAAAAHADHEGAGETEMSTIKQRTPDAAAERLDKVLAMQPDDAKQRYAYRHPRETLAFFGIKPGMVVVEALPGGGWYSKILIPYLGPQGHLIGADYAQDMFPLFGFFNDEFIAAKKTWTTDWPADARSWYGEEGAKVSAFAFGSMPASVVGSADAVLMIRALHNLARFEGQGGYLTTALDDAYRALRPGGILGVVQHWGPDELPDSWADGSRGYLKRDFVIDRIEQAGFELVDSSAVNHNHRDQPGEEDIVWRLPPTLVTSREDPALREQMQAIGESHRMTLKFRKPL